MTKRESAPIGLRVNAGKERSQYALVVVVTAMRSEGTRQMQTVVRTIVSSRILKTNHPVRPFAAMPERAAGRTFQLATTTHDHGIWC